MLPCTCGLNHDLNWLGGDLALKLNPKYWDEYKKQECPKSPKLTKEEIEAEYKMVRK